MLDTHSLSLGMRDDIIVPVGPSLVLASGRMLSINKADSGPFQASFPGEQYLEKQWERKVTKGARNTARDDLWALDGHEALHCIQQRNSCPTWAAAGALRGSWGNQLILDKLLVVEVPLDCVVKAGPRFLGNFRALASPVKLSYQVISKGL